MGCLVPGTFWPSRFGRSQSKSHNSQSCSRRLSCEGIAESSNVSLVDSDSMGEPSGDNPSKTSCCGATTSSIWLACAWTLGPFPLSGFARGLWSDSASRGRCRWRFRGLPECCPWFYTGPTGSLNRKSLQLGSRGDGIEERWIVSCGEDSVLPGMECVVVFLVKSSWVGIRSSIHFLTRAGSMVAFVKAQVVGRCGGYDTDGNNDNGDSEHIPARLDS
jgi:hypothetical protein